MHKLSAMNTNKIVVAEWSRLWVFSMAVPDLNAG